ncbi:hypothetical protein AC1031_011665 [Aphanomyces cochlioides]|nr:hypothetical protein AC1031_011665 [Aphanomyces cochlioides]
MRHIQGDELCNDPLRQMQILSWTDLRRLRDGRTLVRSVNVVPIHLIDSGLGSLDEWSKQLDLDTTHLEETDKIHAIRLELAERSCANEQISQSKVINALDKIQHEVMPMRLATPPS